MYILKVTKSRGQGMGHESSIRSESPSREGPLCTKRPRMAHWCPREIKRAFTMGVSEPEGGAEGTHVEELAAAVMTD